MENKQQEEEDGYIDVIKINKHEDNQVVNEKMISEAIKKDHTIAYVDDGLSGRRRVNNQYIEEEDNIGKTKKYVNESGKSVHD